MKAIDVFERYEKKYLMTRSQYKKLKMVLKERMEIDEYGLHTICNVYFDTPDYYLIRTSLSKPLYKEKFRLRSYGIPKENDKVFLEIKKKFDGIVYKRRIPLTLSEAEQYLYQNKRMKEQTQIGTEIDWMFERYNLLPAVYIAYDRIAMYDKEDPNLRVTFDQNIRFRENNLHLNKGSYGQNILDDERVLMEVKIPGSMPMWMSQLFSELGIFSGSFSKYGYCYNNFMTNMNMKKGGIDCA